MESHFIPKEEIGLASVFLYRLNGKQQGFFLFFFCKLCFCRDSPISWLCGASGVDLCQKQELKAPQGALWDRSCPSFMFSATSSSGRNTFLQKRQVPWCGHAERAALSFGPVPPTICQDSCLVTCPLLFLLFTQDECDTGGFLQSRR